MGRLGGHATCTLWAQTNVIQADCGDFLLGYLVVNRDLQDPVDEQRPIRGQLLLRPQDLVSAEDPSFLRVPMMVWSEEWVNIGTRYVLLS